MMKKIGLILLLIAAFATPPTFVPPAYANAQQDYEKGWAAYDAGDYITAYRWLNKAASNGHKDAKAVLDALENLMTLAQIEKARAKK